MGNIIRRTGNSLIPEKEIPNYTHDSYPLHKSFDLHRILNCLVKRKLLIILVALSVLTAVTLYSVLAKPVFRSVAVLQIEPEAVRVLPYPTVSDSLVKSPGDFDLYMKTQDQLIRGPVLISRAQEKVAAKFPNLQDLEIEGDFAAGMQVLRIEGSQMVQIFYESYNPQFSAFAANTIADDFIDYHFERKVETTRKATEFLQDQLASQKTKVEDAEAAMVRYAKEHNILDEGGNQMNVIRERFGLLNTQVADAERQLIARRAAYDEIKNITIEKFPSRLRTQEIANLETQIRNAEQELSTLRLQFGENWPDVIRKRQELSLAQEQYEALEQDTLSQAKLDAKTGYQSTLKEYNDLSQKYREQQQLVNRLNEASIQYNTLKRDSEASDRLYQGLIQRLEETGVGATLEFGNIHKTTPAKASLIPYKPRILWNISLGLFLGLAAGIWLALFLEYMDRSLKDPADLESMEIPLLGWIPAMEVSTKKQEKISTGKKGSSKINLVEKTPSTRALTPHTLQTWNVGTRESFRSIVASLLLSKAGTPARTILITSSIPKEGKSTVVENIGRTLAEIGSKTLLIDADFRNPSLSNRFGVRNGKGLSVFLAGGDLNIQETGVSNLFILPSGPMPPNPIALLISTLFSDTIADLKKEFQYVLIDSPPILNLADPCVIAPKVDGVILVVTSDGVPTGLISRSNQKLKRSGAHLLGAAVNRVNLKNPENRYYRKYYYYQQYGSEANNNNSPGKIN